MSMLISVKGKPPKLSKGCAVTGPRNLRFLRLGDVFLAGAKKGRAFGVYPIPFSSTA